MKAVTQVILIVATLAALAGGATFLVRQSSSGGEIEILLPTAAPAVEIDARVYVSGAVRTPGVYAVDEGDRLADVIELAGGATDEADLAAVNLAVRVRDEDHLYIPRQGESFRPQRSQGVTGSGKMDINSATARELQALPGIGEVRSESIIRYRGANGPFSSVEDLLGVRGIGAATLDAIRDLIEVR